MKYAVIDVKKTNNRTYPFVVEYSDNKAVKYKYFNKEESAKRWADWLTEVSALSLPLGITLDIRKQDYPFLARIRKSDGRIHEYFATLQSAEAWLKEKRGQYDETYWDRHAKYHGSYKQYGKRGDPCIYCGVASNTMDHIPPLGIAEPMMYEGLSNRFEIVPACSECNDTLSNVRELNIVTRQAYLYNRYLIKYEATLARIELAESFAVRVLRERLRNLRSS